MAAIALDEPITASSFLFARGGGVPELASELARELADRGAFDVASNALGAAVGAGGTAVRDELARAVHGLLDIDLGTVLLSGWAKWRALTDAARRTRDAPGTTEVVPLVEHTVASTLTPYVDLVVSDVRLATVHLELGIELTLRGVEATLRDGALVALGGGSCEVAVALAVEGQEVTRRTAELPPAVLVRVGSGIPLVAAGAPEPRPPAAAGPRPPTIHLPPSRRRGAPR
jgi:hypothetical protein